MTANQDRAVALPLDFLGRGKYDLTLWQDAPDADTDPNHLVMVTKQVSAQDPLKIPVATDGGFVARFSPAGK
jgi:alpha-glucosidase